MTTDIFRPGVASSIKWFGSSPDAGDPVCICSYCGERILDDEVPIRIFSEDNTEARLHDFCATFVINWSALRVDRWGEKGDDQHEYD